MKFDTAKIVVISVVAFAIIIITLFCTIKWYQETKKNPCQGCCSFFCCCKKKRKNKKKDVHEDSSAGFDDHWTYDGDASSLNRVDQKKLTEKKTFCMKFCISEPVQDCCEFFDCDIMWHKKNNYAHP